MDIRLSSPIHNSTFSTSALGAPRRMNRITETSPAALMTFESPIITDKLNASATSKFSINARAM